MHFEDDFFEGEERNGFYIRPMMKRVWAVQLEILETVSRICRKHNIKWFADSGTLLGAARDGGFIAWDDDLDIAMLRMDYERFMKIARSELPKGWRLINGRQDKDPYEAVLRVTNAGRITTAPDHLKRYHGCPYVVGVDIFAIDNIPDDTEEEDTFRRLAAAAYNSFKEAGRGLLLEECSEEVRQETADLESLCNLTLDHDNPIKPQLLDLADRLSAMYFDCDTQNMTIVPFYCVDPKIRFSKEAYAETVRLPFESTTIPAPKGYDEVLRAWYGDDYMTPKRVAAMHEYPYFAEAERALKKGYEDRECDFPKEFE